MKGDRLVISPHHTKMATELCEHISARNPERLVVSVAGESGAGKSELGSELARVLDASGIASDVLQQDDYFVFPPKTNHEMRRRNIEQVGLYEVKLDLLDVNLRSFHRGENPILKPLVDYDADAIGREERDLSAVRVLVVEGTYVTSLEHVDVRVFINRTWQDTAAHRAERGRDPFEPFIEDVLRREHAIISTHAHLADFIVNRDFDNLSVTAEKETP